MNNNCMHTECGLKRYSAEDNDDGTVTMEFAFTCGEGTTLLLPMTMTELIGDVHALMDHDALEELTDDVVERGAAAIPDHYEEDL